MPKKIYKIIFLGNSSVGKTTLISQYLYSKTPETAPTIGIDFFNYSYNVDGQNIRLQIWDTAGQERFHSVVGNYTRNTFLAVIVFSIDSPESLQNIEMWIRDFTLTHNNIEDVHILVVGNKMDVKISEFEKVYEKARTISEKYQAKLITTSAIDKDGIKDLSNSIKEFVVQDLEKNSKDRENKANAIISSHRRKCC